MVFHGIWGIVDTAIIATFDIVAVTMLLRPEPTKVRVKPLSADSSIHSLPEQVHFVAYLLLSRNQRCMWRNHLATILARNQVHHASRLFSVYTLQKFSCTK